MGTIEAGRDAVAGLLGALALAAAAPGPDALPVLERVERSAKPGDLGIEGAPNPYDPDEVRVDAEIVLADGSKATLPCFWYVPCERHFVEAPGDDSKVRRRWERFRPAGEGDWRFRFRPSIPGRHTYAFVVDRGGKRWRKSGGEFNAQASTGPPGGRPGPIRLGRDPRYFADAGGRTFVPIGHNLGWPDESGSEGYAGWLDDLAAAGGNASRLWLVHYYGGTALEWSRSEHNAGYQGAGRFSQEAAARVDRILEAAEGRGVHLMLSFFSFGDHNWDWPENPYNREAGGWLETPAQFFTDARARRSVRNLLRYTVARFGHSPNVWAWELWNEVETSRGYAADAVRDWHREMAAEIRRLDAHGHLVTTSYRFAPPITPCPAYGLPEIDFAQVHLYGPHLLAGLDDAVRATWKFGKPVVAGECGLWVVPNYFRADPAGLHLHDGAWGAVFAGAAGSGMAWWWERFIHPNGLCFHYTGLARFLEGEDLADARTCTVLLREAPERYFALALKTRRGALGWVGRSREARWAAATAGEESRLESYDCEAGGGPVEASLEGDFRGPRRIVFYDAFDGVPAGETRAAGTEKGIAFRIPAFRHDTAFKCVPGGATDSPPLERSPTPIHDRFERMRADAARPSDAAPGASGRPSARPSPGSRAPPSRARSRGR